MFKKMNSKACAKCSKTVYPIEEFKCLDKTWHKLCFKCTDCNMTLNMKTYKGFDKMPYCEAHVPRAKATTVAETPELKRIQENTKIQSNAAYHSSYNQSKGTYTPITDDPELLRIKANTKIISNVAYHGDLEKKQKMEEKRNLGEGDKPPPQQVQKRSSGNKMMDELNSVPGGVLHNVDTKKYATSTSVPPPQYQQQQQQLQQQQQQQQSYINNHNYNQRGHQVIYSSDGRAPPTNPIQPGSIADYDPMNNYYGSVAPPPPTTNTPQHHQHQQIRSSSYPTKYRALYDYEAQDVDELSFQEGDWILECSEIDEGWLTGTNQRTRARGMLPANYVKECQ